MGSKDKSSMTGDTLWRKWQEIRNKLRNSIISSSNIAQDLHKLPSRQGLKDAYFKFVMNSEHKIKFVMNSEHLCIDCNNFVYSIFCDGFSKSTEHLVLWCLLFYAQL